MKRKRVPDWELESVTETNQTIESDQSVYSDAIASKTGASDLPQSPALIENHVSIMDISRSHHEVPVQPVLNEYPQTSMRRFNCGYFKQFPWIEYSINRDVIFCFSCRHLNSSIVRPGETSGNITFVDKGFKK